MVPQFERELSKASSDTYHSEHDSASLQLSEQTDNNNISPIEYHTYGSQGQVEGDHGKSLDSRTLGEDGFQPQSYGWNSLTGYHDHQLGLRVPTSTSQSEIVPQTAPYFEKGNFAESLSSTEDTWPGRIEMVTTPRDQEVYQLSVPQNRNLFYGASSSPFNGYAMDGGYHLGNRPRNDPYTLINSSLSATPMEPVSQQANAPDLHGDFANYQLQFGESNVSQQEQFFTNNNPHGLPNRGEWDNLLWPGEENDGRS